LENDVRYLIILRTKFEQEWLKIEKEVQHLFFEVYGHIIRKYVPPSVLHLFSAFQLLALEKQFGGTHPITINEVTYHLIARTLAI
jgi:hypothetical protein